MTSHSQKVGAAGAVLVAVLGLTPAACLLAQALLPGGGAALERLVVAFAELLFLCTAFLTPGLGLPRMGDWHPAAIWLVLAWFLFATCATLNAEMPAVALVRQAEWVLHGMFAAMASACLAHPVVRRKAMAAAALGLLTASGMLAASWSPPWSEWGRAWDMIAHAPLVGIGADQYAYLRPGHDHPGNGFLQLALDWGAPGALVVLAGMGTVMARARARGRRVGLALVLGLMAAGLVSGTFYHSSMLLFLSFGMALCLDLQPAHQHGFDKDIHGLTILSAAVLLAQVVLVKSLLLAPVPPVDGLTAHVMRHVPLAMGWDGAGKALERWATEWRTADKAAAYRLLDWSARHARRPESSLRLQARWFREDGFEAEARYTMRQVETAAW